jgi:type II secretory pathway component PulJ
MICISNNKKYSRGVTLIEVVVTVGITAIIGMAIATFFTDTFKLNAIISNDLSASGDARRTIKTMTAEIRTASPSNLGTYPLESTATSSFTFYSNIDEDGLKERVRYYLEGGILKKGVIKPTGNPLAYSGAEVVTELVHNVQNGTTSIFSYYDTTYNGTSAPLSGAFAITAVRLVRVAVGIDSDVNKDPGVRWYTTQVSFRNLKDNL